MALQREIEMIELLQCPFEGMKKVNQRACARIRAEL